MPITLRPLATVFLLAALDSTAPARADDYRTTRAGQAAVGTVFGRYSVNIAQMSVGRNSEKPGGEAVGVLNLDSLPPQKAIDEVLATRGVKSVRVFALPPAGQLPSWLQ